MYCRFAFCAIGTLPSAIGDERLRREEPVGGVDQVDESDLTKVGADRDDCRIEARAVKVVRPDEREERVAREVLELRADSSSPARVSSQARP